ncbi:MAG: hypothetical protein AN485_24185, partial [Anabaena sp. MDT14b]
MHAFEFQAFARQAQATHLLVEHADPAQGKGRVVAECLQKRRHGHAGDACIDHHHRVAVVARRLQAGLAHKALVRALQHHAGAVGRAALEHHLARVYPKQMARPLACGKQTLAFVQLQRFAIGREGRGQEDKWSEERG